MDKFKKFMKYWGAAYIVIFSLMLMHYPPVYFFGTTLEYLTRSDNIENVLVFMTINAGWALLFIPFLIIARTKYLSIVFIGTFAFFVGFEKYMFYIQHNFAPWNIGFSEPMLINFLSVPAIGGFLDAFQTYGNDKFFFIYLIIFPLSIFFVVKFISKRLPEVEIPYIKPIAIGLIILVPTIFETQDSSPYVYRVMYTIDNYIVDIGREKILNYKRKEIYFKDVNKEGTPTNIIMIMDESIRGDLVSLTNEKLKEEQPFMYSLKDKIINFGKLILCCKLFRSIKFILIKRSFY